MTGLQVVSKVLLVDVIFGTKGALDVPGDVLLAATISTEAGLLMGDAVLFGIELLIAKLTVGNVGRIMAFQVTI